MLCSVFLAGPAVAQEESVVPLETEVIFLMPFADDTQDANNQNRLNQLVIDNFGNREPFVVQDLASLSDQGLPPDVVIDASCQKSECLDEIAQSIQVRGMIYGKLEPTPDGFKWVLKLFDADKGRIVAKTEVEASTLDLVAEQTPTLVENLMAEISPRPPKPPPVKKTIWENPIFVSGAALSAVATTALVGSVAYVVDAELRLGDPDVHRELKAEALAYGPNGLWLALASGAVLVVGLGVTGVGFVLHE